MTLAGYLIGCLAVAVALGVAGGLISAWLANRKVRNEWVATGRRWPYDDENLVASFALWLIRRWYKHKDRDLAQRIHMLAAEFDPHPGEPWTSVADLPADISTPEAREAYARSRQA